jgi:hypothetical protein
MSLAIDLTDCQRRLSEGQKAISAELRKLRDVVPPAIYGMMQAHLCSVASETNRLKVLLGSLRMIGELEQMPPPVTLERLELAKCVASVPMLPLHEIRDESAAFARELARAGDDTLDGREAA